MGIYSTQYSVQLPVLVYRLSQDRPGDLARTDPSLAVQECKLSRALRDLLRLLGLLLRHNHVSLGLVWVGLVSSGPSARLASGEFSHVMIWGLQFLR